jgi:hypothetical protein
MHGLSNISLRTSASEYLASKGDMINNNLEGLWKDAFIAQIHVLSRYFSRRTRENREHFRSG